MEILCKNQKGPCKGRALPGAVSLPPQEASLQFLTQLGSLKEGHVRGLASWTGPHTFFETLQHGSSLFHREKSRFSDGALLSQGGPSAENRTKEA